MEEMTIQLTLTHEEIEALEKATRWAINDKSDCYQAVLMAIQEYCKGE